MTLPDPASLQFLQDMGLLFRTVNFNFREAVDRALREGGVDLSFGQISTLGILRERPGSNGSEIARHAMVSPQAMHGVLRELVREHYLERRDHPGSLRADAWHITARGQKMLARAGVIFGAVMSRMLSPLDAREQREFERYLRLCAGSLALPALPPPPDGEGRGVSAARRATSAGAPRRRSSKKPSESGR